MALTGQASLPYSGLNPLTVRIRAVTARGDSGFRTASFVDPFGNVLGVMHNPHYLEVLETATRA